MRSSSRSSSRARGPAGEVGDDVWVLRGLRPGSAGSRKRTASPAGGDGSCRSQNGGKIRSRPRGRDVFGTPEVQEQGVVDDEAMIDDQSNSAGLLLPPPPPSRGSSINDVEMTSRRKRPGYFSAREEDLDPLEMDVEDFIMPSRKKQKLSSASASTQGPKFAALWEPSRRKNWPLGEEDESTKKAQESQRKGVEERERIKNDLKDLESPAFKLPPSARKETDTTSMDIEQSTPTKAPQKDEIDYMFQSSKPLTNSTELPVRNIGEPAPQESRLLMNPVKQTDNGTTSITSQFAKQPTRPPTPPKPVEKSSETKLQPPQPPGFLFGSPTSETTKPTTTGGPETMISPSKTATFMETILLNKPPDIKEETLAAATLKGSGVEATKVPQTQSQPSAPVSLSSLPTSQTTSSGVSQETRNNMEEKPETNGGFKFGSSGEFPGISSSTFGFKPTLPLSVPPPKESVETISWPTRPTFNLDASKQSEEPKPDKVDSIPVSAFEFGKPESKQESAPIDTNIPETKKEPAVVPTFGGPSVFGSFGGAFTKSEPEKPKDLFGAPASGSNLAAVSTLNGVNPVLPVPHSAPPFGTGTTTGFNFGKPPEIPAPKKDVTPPPVPAPPVSQEIDDSMDITDSPPASRTLPFTGLPGDTPSRFPSFPTSAPTSAPISTVEPPKPAFQFGTATASQVNGATDKPAPPTFKFGAPTEEKKPGFSAPAFGAPVGPPFGVTASSPTPTGFSGFVNTFPKKDEMTENQKPVEKPLFASSTPAVPTFGAPTHPSESKPLFGGSTTAPAFGTTAPTFGTASLFPPATAAQPTTTSPPALTSQPTAPTFSFSFAPASHTQQPFGSGSTFSFSAASSVNNPFASNPAPSATSPATFQGVNSAPVSPPNQQLATLPGVQPQFGTTPQSTVPFGGTAVPPSSFQLQQTIPQTPIFTLGSSQMQRSSSDAGPNNASPGGRKIAQPGRRRLNRRG